MSSVSASDRCYSERSEPRRKSPRRGAEYCRFCGQFLAAHFAVFTAARLGRGSPQVRFVHAAGCDVPRYYGAQGSKQTHVSGLFALMSSLLSRTVSGSMLPFRWSSVMANFESADFSMVWLAEMSSAESRAILSRPSG